ncbi:unnamed protein product [Vitrella brassicaformis CCMP3155]|uniref:thioredoxin-disulfide reductase (NADPH) n=1 Tax=Vitrella brassicaformis (strain CCMP3155) TaxID=1169540 RepID=A0A0G4GMW4_VITBC|nr:unnamed protein product [Vitrella brassicaformis CCMP3155]|eukprot:CEM31551.1 unnamed protein product [Vitrella brassicaformis CCMP3155]
MAPIAILAAILFCNVAASNVEEMAAGHEAHVTNNKSTCPHSFVEDTQTLAKAKHPTSKESDVVSDEVQGAVIGGIIGGKNGSAGAVGGAMHGTGGAMYGGLMGSSGTATSAAPLSRYDLVVIGGGSGGMAAAKEAAKLGKRVALFDYPSPQGTTWGIGGTCLNVGCIPRKLMHYAALIGASFYDARLLGWQLPDVRGQGHSGIAHDWGQLVKFVRNKVRQLRFSYGNALRSYGNSLTYVNALARFESAGVIEYENPSSGETQKLTADKVLIAVGGRPNIPEDIPGAVEHDITSDDIFTLDRPPGRTLVVGAGYIALETAGFLNEINFDVSVAVRSVVLRGFDRQCAEKIAQLMAEVGVRFMYSVTVGSITKKQPDESGLPSLEVELRSRDGNIVTEVYNTVLFATGRTPETASLGLDAVGVKYDAQTSKIAVNDVEQTSVPNVYAVGDCIPQLELTPVAVRAGEVLARRLYGGSTEKMDYEMVPTTVFTPFEYGSVGLSEEQAVKKYGKDAIETFLLEVETAHTDPPALSRLAHSSAPLLTHFEDLELSGVHRPKVATARSDGFDIFLSASNLSKLVCLRNENNRVVGFHYVGRNAGEVTQGFALALRLGATKSDFDRMLGIQPTDAESFSGLTVTRRSGESFVAAGGCGGGRCG